jgi:hypothetical protein
MASNVVVNGTQITASAPALNAGTLNDIAITGTTPLSRGWMADFLDVPRSNGYHPWVELIFRHGITGGCGGGNFCPSGLVTREQVAVFLLTAKHGAGYSPPVCKGVFADVPCPSPFADWIEELVAEGITGGCGGGRYCPKNPVTRAEISVFLLTAKNGAGYVPPPCKGIFSDVPCPSLFADWIEELCALGVNGACATEPARYCPGDPNSRDYMAVFLQLTFNLQ